MIAPDQSSPSLPHEAHSVWGSTLSVRLQSRIMNTGCRPEAADQTPLAVVIPVTALIRNLPDGQFVLLGHNGRWPNALRRAAT